VPEVARNRHTVIQAEFSEPGYQSATNFQPRSAYGLPTNVVTDCAVRDALNRPTVTVMAVPATSLEQVVATYGVTDAGHAVPDTKKETCYVGVAHTLFRAPGANGMPMFRRYLRPSFWRARVNASP
jgi:hypothetical protein